jgi:hypothetical protein
MASSSSLWWAPFSVIYYDYCVSQFLSLWWSIQTDPLRRGRLIWAHELRGFSPRLFWACGEAEHRGRRSWWSTAPHLMAAGEQRETGRGQWPMFSLKAAPPNNPVSLNSLINSLMNLASSWSSHFALVPPARDQMLNTQAFVGTLQIRTITNTISMKVMKYLFARCSKNHSWTK